MHFALLLLSVLLMVLNSLLLVPVCLWNGWQHTAPAAHCI
jgi:hypothetical protein